MLGTDANGFQRGLQLIGLGCDPQHVDGLRQSATAFAGAVIVPDGRSSDNVSG